MCSRRLFTANLQKGNKFGDIEPNRRACTILPLNFAWSPLNKILDRMCYIQSLLKS